MNQKAKSQTGELSSDRREASGEPAQSADRSSPADPTAVERAKELVFGQRLPVVERYAELLTTVGVERGLIGPREVSRIWDRHLLNCGVLASEPVAGSTVCDVGSGAGLPGLVIAILRDDLEITLVEPLLRRTIFLDEVIDALRLPQVRVVRARAEDHDGVYDVVTARAVAPLEKLATLTLPLCKSGGYVLAVKGVRAEEELSTAARELRRLGASSWEVERFGEGVIEPPTTAIRIVAGSASSVR